jgi:hypothetical protein
LPAKTRSFDENVRSGNESPLIPIPPPPPPFKMPAWKFLEQGDFVRIQSYTSSRSGSPDHLDETDGDGDPSTSTSTSTPTPTFCPSPDVDTKADSFIARFRANLKLEKMNSIKQKRGPDTDTVDGGAGAPC